MWIQREILLRARQRGCHVVTGEVVNSLPELGQFQVGLCHVFIQHTSASLSLNENADPDVRVDLESALNELAPEHASYITHTLEGSDDMPAHIKASLMGSSVTMPISRGRLVLGHWQGIYLCEHRDDGGERKLMITLHGPGEAEDR